MADELKSAYELAMERLREQDAEQGITPDRPLTAKQKKRIAEARAEAKAKHAELEILHRKAIEATGGDPEQIQKAEERYAIDRRRVDSALDSAIARIKSGD